MKIFLKVFSFSLACLTLAMACVSVSAANPSDGQRATVANREVMPDTWVFTDGLGRESLTYEDVGDLKEDKTLAMFYWTWHTQHCMNKGYVNTSQIMATYPEAKNDYNHPAWSAGHYCFWNEPIYGYYSTEDPWVLRRQAELLANAGVDTIITDNTNGTHTWRESYLVLYETWLNAMKNGGVDVPQVTYMLPFWDNDATNQQLKTIYADIYSNTKYKDLWFYLDGKPMIMALDDSFQSGSTALDTEIYNFFTWRQGEPSYTVKRGVGKWGWLSTYPQGVFYKDINDRRKQIVEQTTVGVAVNHNYKNKEMSAMNGNYVMGRSYTADYQNRYAVEGAEASKWGYQFSAQFDYALQQDAKVIFVTGWNEWHAWRQPEPWGGVNSQVNNALADQFDDEFSRDLEPTKGALKDHYYYLFINYARQYKGCRPIPTPSTATTVNIDGNLRQWDKVEPYFAAYSGNTGDRSYRGYGSNYYTETSGRNDIVGAQVARDDKYVYFHVECADTITPYTDNLWMTLYLDTDQDNQGWETFDFVIGKSAATADKVVLEKFTGDGYNTRKVAECDYTLNGKHLVIKVPKAKLRLSGYDFTINFTWTDNVHDEGNTGAFSGDIMDFYISGDVAPGARFKYSYVSTQYNATGIAPETEAPIEAATEPVTDAELITEGEPMTDAVTDDAVDTIADTVADAVTQTDVETAADATSSAVTEADTSAETTSQGLQRGCDSALPPAVSLAVIAAGGLALRKKKKEE